MSTILSVGTRPRHIPFSLGTRHCLNSNIFSQLSTTFAIALTLPVLFAATVHAQVATSTVPLAGHTPLQVLNGNAIPVGHYSPAQKLRLTLAIQPPHMAEEEEFLSELTTKGSPNFHQFLTPEEWNARFAPSPEDEQKVVEWATSVGFTVTHRFNHRLLVDVEAPSGMIEKALGVTINNYQVGDEVDFSNDRDPVLPANLSGIVYSVQGLNSIQRDHGSRPGPDIKGPDYAEGPAVAPGPHDQSDAITPAAPSPPPSPVTTRPITPSSTATATSLPEAYSTPRSTTTTDCKTSATAAILTTTATAHPTSPTSP
jgi:subtilase family serine protease